MCYIPPWQIFEYITRRAWLRNLDPSIILYEAFTFWLYIIIFGSNLLYWTVADLNLTFIKLCWVKKSIYRFLLKNFLIQFCENISRFNKYFLIRGGINMEVFLISFFINQLIPIIFGSNLLYWTVAHLNLISLNLI